MTNEIKQMRQELYLTQKQLAEYLGTSTRTLQRVERGATRKLYRLAVSAIADGFMRLKPSEIDMVSLLNRTEMRNQIMELKQENERLRHRVEYLEGLFDKLFRNPDLFDYMFPTKNKELKAKRRKAIEETKKAKDEHCQRCLVICVHSQAL